MSRLSRLPPLLSGLLLLRLAVASSLALAGDSPAPPPLIAPGDALRHPAAPAAPAAVPTPAATPEAAAEGADTPAADADTPADEPVEPSLWEAVGGGDATAPEAAASSEELAEERLSEASYTGNLGAEPPIEFYLDPLAATAIDPLQVDKVDPREFDIPVVMNDHVKEWMTYFLGRGRKYYARYLMRSTRWIPMMREELAARGMPRDLVYLSMIESGFTTSATSYVSAAGLWQFMPATGRQYGLRVDWWVDERRDPVKATHAALDYLAYLNRMFEGDWWLAWAGYNGGEGHVLRATQRQGTTDFWTLVERNALHPETQNYVPKLLAAAIIGHHPERYGFVGVKYQDAFAFDEVPIPGATGLDVIARCAGVSEEELLDYNPALRRWALPPDPESWSVRLPPGKKDAFLVAFAQVPPEERVTLARHVVKRGETLRSIAKKYGISTDEVASLNHLKAKARIRVGDELIVPAHPGSAGAAVALASVASLDPETSHTSGGSKTSGAGSSTAAKTHTVKSGETLGKIAAKYHLSVGQLKAMNGLRSDRINAGVKLKVGEVAAAEPSTAKASKAASEAVTEKPSAAKQSAAKTTSAKSGSEEKPTKTASYTVRKGDTLGSIAERYDCSVSEIQSWNGLRGSTIYPGQKLKIKR